MTTYCGTTDNVTTTGAPTDVTVAGSDLEAVLHTVWRSLDPHLRVAGFALSGDNATTNPIIVA